MPFLIPLRALSLWLVAGMESTMLGNTTSMVLSTCLFRQAALFKRAARVRGRAPNALAHSHRTAYALHQHILMAKSKTKSSSKSKSSSRRRAAADMVVPGFTRSAGAYGRYQPGGPELKWTDANVAPAAVPTGLATVFQTLNLVNQGTGPNERIGRTIIVKHIEIKINLQCSWNIAALANALLSNISYRVDLILDKQCNGALPNGADIYDTLIAGVSPENRFPNLLNSDRFVIMKRWEGDFNPPSFALTQAAGADSAVTVGRDLKYAKKCNIRIELSPQAVTTIADVRSNNLFLVYSCSQGVPGQLGFQVVNTSDTRIRFHDA